MSGHPAKVHPASASPRILIAIMECQGGFLRVAHDRRSQNDRDHVQRTRCDDVQVCTSDVSVELFRDSEGFVVGQRGKIGWVSSLRRA